MKKLLFIILVLTFNSCIDDEYVLLPIQIVEEHQQEGNIEYGNDNNQIFYVDINTTTFITKDGSWNKYVQLPVSYNGYKIKIMCKSTFGIFILKNRTNLKDNFYLSTNNEINFTYKNNIWEID